MSDLSGTVGLYIESNRIWSDIQGEVDQAFESLPADVDAEHITETADGLLEQGPLDPRFQQIVYEAEANAAHQAAQDRIDAYVPNYDHSAPPLPPYRQLPESNPVFNPFTVDLLGLSTGNVSPPTSPNEQELESISELVALERASRAAVAESPLAALEEDPATGSYDFSGKGALTAELHGAIDTGTADAALLLRQSNPAAWDALDSGGAPAAASVIRQQLEDSEDATEREYILGMANPIMREIQLELAENARGADSNDNRNSDNQASFDATVADLSGISTLIGDTDPGRRYVEFYTSGFVSSALEQGNIGRLDEALGFAVEDGNGALFAATFIEQTANRGNAPMATDVLENVSSGFENWRNTVDQRQEEVDSLNEQLASALGYGPLLPEENLDRAVQGHYERYAEEYANRDAGVHTLFSDANILNALIVDSHNLLYNDYSHNSKGKRGIERIENTVFSMFGNERLQRGIQQSGGLIELIDTSLHSGKPSIFSAEHIQASAVRSDDPQQTRLAWVDAIFNSQVAAAAAANESGDELRADRLLEGLGSYDELVDAEERESYRDGLQALRDVVAARNDNDMLAAWNTLGETLDASEKAVGDPVFAERFAAAGMVLSIASIGSRAPDVLINGDVNSRLNLAADTGQLYVNIAESTGAATPRLLKFGKMLGVFKVGLDIAYFPSDGDGAEQALAATSIVGQLGVLFSVPYAGWVAGIAASSLLLYQHLDVTEDNPFARDFLIDGGIDPEIADALTKYDVNGYPGGFAQHAGIAEYLGLSTEQSQTPAGRQAIFEYIGQLNPDEANAYALAAQGLQPENVADVVANSPISGVSEQELIERYDPDGDGIVLATGHEQSNDVLEIQRHRRNVFEPNSSDIIPTPHSVLGLKSWIETYGVVDGERFPEPSNSVQALIEEARG